MTAAEIVSLASGGYMTAGLLGARFMYHNFDWDHYTSDGEKVAFSSFQLVIWPLTLVFFVVANIISAPTRSERKAEKVKQAQLEREQRAADIRRMERELGIGQPAPVVQAKPANPVVSFVKAAMGIPAKPDHRCGLCIPGRTPANHNCPFWPGCQQ